MPVVLPTGNTIGRIYKHDSVQRQWIKSEKNPICNIHIMKCIVW